MKNIRLSALALAAFSFALVACGNDQPPADPGTDGGTSSEAPPEEDTSPITADRANRESVAAAIVKSFARKDWDTLSSFVAPAGVRFTPYTHVDPLGDVTLSPSEIAAFGTDDAMRTWGTTEGSGEPIEMTNAEYLARYVWDHDYRTAPDVRWNTAQNHGSVIDNVQEIYPGASTVEYHFPGFDDQYGGMDWRSLRLVLAQDDDGNYVLYGVIHDEWTP